MGLDMYLEATYSLSNYNFMGKDVQDQFAKVLDSAGITIPEGAHRPDTGSVTVEAAYWRKVNAVHSWFVRNVQDDRDECQRSYVDVDSLETLVTLCEGILASVVWDAPEGVNPLDTDGFTLPPILSYDADKVSEISPQGGFFFGSTDIDGWYFYGLHDTVKMLKPWITAYKKKADVEDYSGLPTFYYQASW